MSGRLMTRLAPWLFMAGALLIWEVAVAAFRTPAFVLPAPSVILADMIRFWPVIAKEAGYTLVTTLIGFGMAIVFGLALGLLVGWSSTIYAGLYPLMVAFNAVPKVAVVPILVLWFGIGAVPAVLTAFLISFFPIVVNVATGLATTEPELEDVLKALGASKLDIMRKVGIPRAMPYFFGSLKVAITLAFVGSVLSESIASNNGVGNLMLQAQAQFQVPLIFACLFVLGGMGVAMYALMAAVEKRTTGWANRSGFGAG